MINYLDNCFNSLLHFVNAELAFAYRFIANFMFFREQKWLRADCSAKVYC